MSDFFIRRPIVAIVLQGLKAGERVIVEGMQKVRPGSEVKPTTAPAAAEPQK